MNAVQKEINARLMNERELSTPTTKKGMSTTTMTFIVVGFFTIMATALSYFGLIQ